MNVVGNELSVDGFVIENSAQGARPAMVQPRHRVEGVGCLCNARGDGRCALFG